MPDEVPPIPDSDKSGGQGGVRRAQGSPSRLAVLQNLVRRLSRATSASDAFFGFVGRLWQVYPVDLMLGVSVDGLAYGSYRVTYRLPAELLRAGEWAKVKALCVPEPLLAPVRTIGWLSELVKGDTPQIIEELDLHRDPVLADIAGAMRSAVAVPVYEDGRVVEWSIGLNARPRSFNPGDLEDALITANLLAAHNAQLELVAEVKRLNTALSRQMDEVAAIQAALRPEGPPSVPGLDVGAAYEGTPLLSGDYHDFFPQASGALGVFIADVSGKGAGAATIAAMLRSMLHAFDPLAWHPAAVLEWANRELVDSRMPMTFVTAVCALIDPANGAVELARAGHPPPLVARAAGPAGAVEGPSAAPMGIDRDLRVEAQTFTLNRGDALVLYTDGVSEAFDEQDRMFGPEGIARALTGASGPAPTAHQAALGVMDALRAHRGVRPVHDDQTLLVIRRG